MKSTKPSSMFLFMLLAIAPLAGATQSPNDKRAADQEDIFAVVLRRQMKDWIRRADDEAEWAEALRDKLAVERARSTVFFVSIKGKDPSDDFMKRFDDIPRTVKKISSSESANIGRTPYDKSSHRAGITFSLDGIKWHDNDEAEVDGGYNCGALCAADFTFTVRRENGKWIVKNSQMNWIS